MCTPTLVIKSISLFIAPISICSFITPLGEITAAAQQQLPNIILLIGDDQGYPYFGFMGADYVYTPNIDKLAADGVLFTDGYVSNNHCRPSWQTLITGILPIDYHQKAFVIMREEFSKTGLPEDKISKPDAAIRKTYSVLMHGDIDYVIVDDEHKVLVYSRFDQNNEVLVAFNNSDKATSVEIPLKYIGRCTEILMGLEIRQVAKMISLELPAGAATILVNRVEQ